MVGSDSGLGHLLVKISEIDDHEGCSRTIKVRSTLFKEKYAVRKNILPGNSKSLWQAVKIATLVGILV